MTMIKCLSDGRCQQNKKATGESGKNRFRVAKIYSDEEWLGLRTWVLIDRSHEFLCGLYDTWFTSSEEAWTEAKRRSDDEKDLIQ